MKETDFLLYILFFTYVIGISKLIHMDEFFLELLTGIFEKLALFNYPLSQLILLLGG